MSILINGSPFTSTAIAFALICGLAVQVDASVNCDNLGITKEVTCSVVFLVSVGTLLLSTYNLLEEVTFIPSSFLKLFVLNANVLSAEPSDATQVVAIVVVSVDLILYGLINFASASIGNTALSPTRL